jgi:CubicO group peptidase (beta-lactamase class C family)
MGGPGNTPPARAFRRGLCLDRMVRGWKGDYLFAPPGDIFSYSGPGYWLAGLVLERVHGKPYADVMREQLFQPLGMERSTLRPIEALTYDFSQGHEAAGEALKVVRPMAENTAMYGTRLVLKTDTEQPLERTGPSTFRTRDGQELAFAFKPGPPRAKYLHMDLLSAIRSGR